MQFLQAMSVELWQREQTAHLEHRQGGLKLVVVACNTVSAVALPMLRALSPVPVVGVIRPAAQTALETSARQAIGVIGTEGTIRSRAYQRTLEELNPGAEIVTQACPLLVPLVEEGWFEHPVTELTLQTYFSSFAPPMFDTLILGCTHYPLLREPLQKVLGADCSLVDSADSTAREVKKLLEKRKWVKTDDVRGELLCFVTDTAHRFSKIAESFLGETPCSVEQVDLQHYLRPTSRVEP